MDSINDADLEYMWVSFKMHLQVYHKGVMVFSSVTGKSSSNLSIRQIEMIKSEYEKKRMDYVFNETPNTECESVGESA